MRDLLRRRARRQRGAVAVEAAIITPVLLILVFGIIEFSLLLRDHVAVSSAVRTGARIASAAAGAGPGSCDAAVTETCTPQSSPALAQAAADAIQQAGSAMPKDSIRYILVYRANAEGYPGANGNTTVSEATCTSNCVKFTWVKSQDKFRYAGGSWDSKTINACINDADATVLGVHMKAEHKFVTGLFGKQMNVADHAVMKFEPLANDECAPGEHQ